MLESSDSDFVLDICTHDTKVSVLGLPVACVQYERWICIRSLTKKVLVRLRISVLWKITKLYKIV